MDKVAKRLTKVVTKKATQQVTHGGARAITFETAKLAKFADGACTCTMGDTSVLVTAVSREGQFKPPGGFVPLTVEYKQKAAAAGRIPMTHMRRDVGITEKEILTGRMIDRSIRPSFIKGYQLDTQIVCNLLAVDGNNDPDVLAINGASASLAISDIPWDGPIGAVRVGLIGEQPVANPTRRELQESRLNLVMAANGMGNVMMMDGGCKEPILMPDIIKAMRFGVKECRSTVESIKGLQKLYGKPKRQMDLSNVVATKEHIEFVQNLAQNEVAAVLSNYSYDKISRDEAMKEVQANVMPRAQERFPEIEQSILNEAFGHVVRNVYRKILLETNIRCDGRKLTDLRPIHCEIDLYKPLHGSALFQRGQTQVLCSTTFDSADAAFRLDSMSSLVSGVKEKNFMLHYEFPKFATRDIGRVGTMPDRREIGHGALAERAIVPLVPENADMTIRLNCEVLESNGSSSMASVCAGSMSLMDAGVALKEHVAGVAMGLISDTSELSAEIPVESSHCILTDILGFEDFIGDMDFKIAGTRKGVTAVQLDVKPKNGVPTAILYQALERAHTARGEIINLMHKAIRTPRVEKKPNHPVIKTIRIPPHKVASFIGFSGANLKKLMATIGVRVSAYGGATTGSDEQANELASEQRDNFIVFAPNQEAMDEAEEYIKSIVESQREPELEFNGIYTATIQEIRSNGVMVILYANMSPALLRLSQLDTRTVSHPSALNLEVGQQIQVKYFGRDPATGQMRLSRKSLMMSSYPRVQKLDQE